METSGNNLASETQPVRGTPSDEKSALGDFKPPLATHTKSLSEVGALGAARTSQEHARRLVRAGWWIILGAIIPIGVWIGFAPLSMAVVAPAFVKVDLNRRPVQHLEGGIVRAVLVRDGQHVNAGDPVLLLGDVGVDADRNRLLYRPQCDKKEVFLEGGFV